MVRERIGTQTGVRTDALNAAELPLALQGLPFPSLPGPHEVVFPPDGFDGLDLPGSGIETGRASKLMAFRGLERVPVETAEAGDIIAVAGDPVADVARLQQVDFVMHRGRVHKLGGERRATAGR